MSATVVASAVTAPVLARLDDQIDWYDKKSSTSQRYYKRIKLTEIIAAALIPFVVGAHIPYAAWIAGGLGVLITILEGVLQLYQYQQIWVAYRATAEAMKHESLTSRRRGIMPKRLIPGALLAERVEALGSQENTKWASLAQQEQKVKAGAQP